MTGTGLGDSVAVVTGSTRGIGLEVARALLAEGAAVVVNGRGRTAVDEAVEALSGPGRRVRGVAGSAGDPGVAERLVDAATAFGTPDVLVTCAGTAEPPGSSILSVGSDDWHDLLEAHVHSVFEVCRAMAPLMVAAGGGRIVTTSSHAFTGVFGGTGYPAGKGAVVSLTYALAAELAEHRVRVNAVCPGAATRLSTGEDHRDAMQALHRRGVLDDVLLQGALHPPPPAYVAPLYVYLASPLSEGVTGEVFSAAGGYLGRFPRPREQLVAYRDHAESPPYTPEEVAALVAGAGG